MCFPACFTSMGSEGNQGSYRLSDLMEKRAQVLAAHERVSIGEMLQLLGDRSIAGLLLMLALPMAVPLPVPGLSIPFGAALMLVAAQLALGRNHAWLPGFVVRRTLAKETFTKLIARMVSLLRRFEHVVRPRGKWFTARWMVFPLGMICLVLALLVALPMPLSNALPGMAIALLALGMLERDGVVIGAGLLASTAGIAVVIVASNGLYDVVADWWHSHR